MEDLADPADLSALLGDARRRLVEMETRNRLIHVNRSAKLGCILDPADLKGPDYPSETFCVLKEEEIRQHGEYRTRRLVLAGSDRMEANGEFAAMGM